MNNNAMHLDIYDAYVARLLFHGKILIKKNFETF